jgi:hypothetical protein
MLTTQRQVRRAFWSDHEGFPHISRRRIRNYSGNGLMHNTDTRCAFADYVDWLARQGMIDEKLAQRVTL